MNVIIYRKKLNKLKTRELSNIKSIVETELTDLLKDNKINKFISIDKILSQITSDYTIKTK